MFFIMGVCDFCLYSKPLYFSNSESRDIKESGDDSFKQYAILLVIDLLWQEYTKLCPFYTKQN